MSKYRTWDVVAIIIALAVMVLITVVLPHFWLLAVRVAIGFVCAVIVFAMYLVVRPSDEIIEIEELLLVVAKNASGIYNASKRLIPRADQLAPDLQEMARSIATLGDRMIRRELKFLSTEVRRLYTLSTSLLACTRFLTGEVSVRYQDFSGKLEDFRSDMHDAVVTIEEINVAIDNSEAKRLASAEADLDFINQLYANNNAAREAAQILKDILKKEM